MRQSPNQNPKGDGSGYIEKDLDLQQPKFFSALSSVGVDGQHKPPQWPTFQHEHMRAHYTQGIKLDSRSDVVYKNCILVLGP